MPRRRQNGIRLQRLVVKNYKALDNLELEFAPPQMKNDPDIHVMGSKNGLGKTSVLESCALLFLAAVSGETEFDLLRDFPGLLERHEVSVDLADLLVRAGEREAIIQGTFLLENEATTVALSLTKARRLLKAKFEGPTTPFRELLREARVNAKELAARFLVSLLALNPEPLLLPRLAYFHSYRKLQEGNPEFGMMVESERYWRRARYRPGINLPISTFKVEMLRLMMTQADLFEDMPDQESSSVLEQLNALVERYAGGRIEKLRPLPDSTLDFRIQPSNRGGSYSIDGLSSGQKEIISTLFLIWQHTRHSPAIVLIDEPELHLNIEWHNDFIDQLQRLAPQNQYIIATHSQEVFGSVPEDRRILLSAAGVSG